MATTIDFLNPVGVTTNDITAFPCFPKDKLIVIDTLTKEETGTREVVYQLTEGSDEYPLTVRVGRYVNAKANNNVGKTNVSLKLTDFAQKAVDGEIMWTLPTDLTIAWGVPGISGVIDKADLIKRLAAAFTLLVPVVAGVLTDAAMTEIGFGVLSKLNEHADS